MPDPNEDQTDAAAGAEDTTKDDAAETGTDDAADETAAEETAAA